MTELRPTERAVAFAGGRRPGDGRLLGEQAEQLTEAERRISTMRRVDVRLAVDLGTTHTVAVIRRGGQPPRALLFDGSPLLASGVFVDAAGTPHTGRDGQRLGAGAPERYEPHPKRRIDEGTVLLGDRELPVELLLTAVLLRVADEARTAGVDPAGATLTCPADWGRPRREVLRAAARRAGLGEVRLVDEPIAAAAYCVEVLGQRVPPGGHLVVFDFGGGTFDVAVVRREPAGLRVLATGGLDDLGGLDVDSALVAHLGQLVGVYDPPAWDRLSAPADPAQRRDRQAFWSEVRAAKEMLSRASTAPVHVPGRGEPMHLTRDELERVAGPLVARAVDETRRVLERSGVPAAGLAGLLLVGGSSRMPLVASRLHARLGVTPTVPEQPELPVAYGALVYGGDGSPGPVSGSPSPCRDVSTAGEPGAGTGRPGPRPPAAPVAPVAPAGWSRRPRRRPRGAGRSCSPWCSSSSAVSRPASSRAPAGWPGRSTPAAPARRRRRPQLGRRRQPRRGRAPRSPRCTACRSPATARPTSWWPGTPSSTRWPAAAGPRSSRCPAAAGRPAGGRWCRSSRPGSG